MRTDHPRAVVTGGAGFIGSHIAEWLCAKGVAVLVVDNLETGDILRVPQAAQLEQGDICDAQVARRIAAFRPEIVVHAAARASVSRSIADPDGDFRVNVTGTQVMVAAAKRARTDRFVLLSSGGAIYGEADGASETTKPNPQSPYGQHKLDAESIVERSGIQYSVARLGNVYGPGQRSDLEGGVIAIFRRCLLTDARVTLYGTGDQERDFIHVGDVVRAVDSMTWTSRTGIWNVATGRSTSIAALLGMMETTHGRSAEISSLPIRAGDIFRSRLAIDKIKRELGWSPRIDLAAGLTRL